MFLSNVTCYAGCAMYLPVTLLLCIFHVLCRLFSCVCDTAQPRISLLCVDSSATVVTDQPPASERMLALGRRGPHSLGTRRSRLRAARRPADCSAAYPVGSTALDLQRSPSIVQSTLHCTTHDKLRGHLSPINVCLVHRKCKARLSPRRDVRLNSARREMRDKAPILLSTAKLELLYEDRVVVAERALHVHRHRALQQIS